MAHLSTRHKDCATIKPRTVVSTPLTSADGLLEAILEINGIQLAQVREPQLRANLAICLQTGTYTGRCQTTDLFDSGGLMLLDERLGVVQR